jgi:hypothetical protein
MNTQPSNALSTPATPPQRYSLDFGSHSCRIRIEGTKPGKVVRVLVKDAAAPAAPPLHGSGVLSDDLSAFVATFATDTGEQTLVCDWPGLKAELSRYPRYD